MKQFRLNERIPEMTRARVTKFGMLTLYMFRKIGFISNLKCHNLLTSKVTIYFNLIENKSLIYGLQIWIVIYNALYCVLFLKYLFRFTRREFVFVDLEEIMSGLTRGP